MTCPGCGEAMREIAGIFRCVTCADATRFLIPGTSAAPGTPEWDIEAAEILEKIAFALQDDPLEGDDPEMPYKLMTAADKIRKNSS